TMGVWRFVPSWTGPSLRSAVFGSSALPGRHPGRARHLIARRHPGNRNRNLPGRRVSHSRAQSGWLSLTPSERAVVDLVSEGLSNPQIGQRLYVSRRTVQTHLAHVFAKL